MAHCVPNWNGHGGESDAFVGDDYPSPGEKWGTLPQKGSLAPYLASLQSSDVPSVWVGDVGANKLHESAGGRGGAKNPDWHGNWPSSQGTQDAVAPPSKPPTSPPSVREDGVLAVNVPVIDIMNPHSGIHEDEMVSWLQYPLDDTLERSYCSDFFGELPNSTVGSMQAIRESLTTGQQQAKNMAARNQPPVTISHMNGNLNHRAVATADAAMAMGAGRAAGVLPQAGVEAFTKVRTQQQPYHSGKWSPDSSANPGKTVVGPTGMTNPMTQQALRAPVLNNNISPSMLLGVKSSSQAVALQQSGAAGRKPLNFSHFAAVPQEMKANLRDIGMTRNAPPAANGSKPVTPYIPTNHPSANNGVVSRPFEAAACSAGSSIAESTTTRQHSEASNRNNGRDGHLEAASEGQQQASLATESSWPSMTNSLASSKDTTDKAPATANSEGTNNHHFHSELRPADQQNGGPNSSDTSNGNRESDERPELPEQRPEPTLTSSSGASGGSGNSAKAAATRGKRRTRDQDESECQSDEEVVELKKPTQRGSTTKRTRAAEVHNLSERRRRDRINEKMKALQELIPNSNKADKASMLDEAIEYLKMLQIQLQMMSMRSGMQIPTLIPSGLQHLQVSQMGGMATMGLGMGMGLASMGMGPMIGGVAPMGMGMLDMNQHMVASGRPSHLMPHLTHGGASHSGTALMPHPTHGAAYNVSQVMPHPSHGGPTQHVSASPAVSMVDSHNDIRLQSSNSALENAYLARQHALQFAPQMQTMDVYNAYMIHQQQQHQQQQQQQQHQHQQQLQQHQMHHLPSNMGGGGLQ